MAERNVLVPGQPRLGWFVDGDPETPRTAVMLQDTGTRIDLTIATDGIAARNGPYGRWWSSGTAYGDDPDRTRHSYAPPRVLHMEDIRGPVTLVGCRAWNSSLGLRVGEGHIVANYAVLGATHLDYEKIHGIRTWMPALTEWVRARSKEFSFEQDGSGRQRTRERTGSFERVVEVGEDQRVKGLQITLHDVEPVALARRLNLALESAWRVDTRPHGAELYDEVVLQTLVQTPRAWDEHLNLHRSVLGLVSMAGWHRFGVSALKARHDQDGEPRRDGTLRPTWRAVATYMLPEDEPLPKNLGFLYPYAEVGPRGVQRWLRLQEDYTDVLTAVLNILWSDNQWGHAALVQSGIALENLGYQIVVQKKGGTGLNSRRQLAYRDALKAILDDMAVTPFEDTDEWIQESIDCYMGAKHADRTTPDTLVQVETLRRNLLVLRFWIGLQIGVRPESLMAAVGRDPLSEAFTLVE